ncbi:MAG: hypothetical protein WC373_15385 [Smithella sp.]
MRATANERGTWETGFRRPDEGWHIGKFLEGIDYLKTKKDGEEIISTNKQGDKNWKFPTVIEDEDDDCNEVKHDIIVAENKRGEQMVADILGCTGLFEKFTKKFPGGESVFDQEVIKLIKTQLPNQFWRFKIKHVVNKKNPDEPYVNIVGFGKVSDTIASLDAAFFPDKKGGKSVGKAKEADKPDVDEVDPFA